MLLNQEDNVVSQGLTLLNEDLAFAEDLILVISFLFCIFFVVGTDGLFCLLCSTKRR